MTPLQTLAAGIPEEIGAAIITGKYNRRYYTGLLSSAGTLLVTREKCRFVIDSRYFEPARKTIKGCEVVLQDKLYEQIGEFFREQGVKTAAVESDICTVKALAEYRENLPGVEIPDDGRLARLISEQRMRKTPEELGHMRAAQAIADRTFSHILGWIKPGKTERDIALEIEFYGRSLGAEGAAFPFIVASGENSAIPHAAPGNRAVRPGDFLTMDFGFISEGYCSDMTRTVAVGHAGERQRMAYGTVLRAQKAGLAAIRPGVICRDVDAAAREIIDSSPFKGSFGHGLGHSLGLELHEQPRFDKLCETPLEPGMALSVEPGIYLPGEFGVRIEDIAAVTGEGCENLTASPKELIILY